MKRLIGALIIIFALPILTGILAIVILDNSFWFGFFFALFYETIMALGIGIILFGLYLLTGENYL